MNFSNKQAIEKLLLSGYTVEFRKISVCKINLYHYNLELEEYKYGWQVSDLTNIYTFPSIKQAIKKFLDLKEKFYGHERKNPNLSKMPTTQRYPL